MIEYHFQPQRMSRVGKFGRIIIKAPGESGTLLSARAWDQVRQLSDQSKLNRQRDNVCVFKVMEVDRMIQDIVVEHEGAEYRYRDVCAKWAGHCRSEVREFSNFGELSSEIPLYLKE